MLPVNGVFENRKGFFGGVKGQNGTAGCICGCLSDEGGSLMGLEGSVFALCQLL